jgi:hypothetical protein
MTQSEKTRNSHENISHIKDHRNTCLTSMTMVEERTFSTEFGKEINKKI